ncbi:MAG: ABC transporter permease [Caldilinea sp. CFX5]|nr:ABC transporter permease [Caldilinea sp. CFX5]
MIAYRDLLRNRRRSFFTGLAVALGLALLIVLNGYIAGVMEGSLQNSIRLQTGHLQLRTPTYTEEKVSLQWKDLLDNPDETVARARALPAVQAAAPVLWATGILNTADESSGVRVYGIDTTSALYAPIQSGMVAGAFLRADDRNGILLGQHLADNLGVGVDQKVSLTIVNADGAPEEGIFTIRGLFNTGIPSYDDSALFMPLSKAQAFTRTGGRASAIMLLLQQQNDADSVGAALASPTIRALTWRDLNAVFLQMMETGLGFYVILDGIVILIVAVIIANTLLMAVFERIREMGILAALGMKRGQIRLMFLLEAAILGLAGVVVGIGIGCAGVAYLATAGIPIGDIGAAANGIAISTVLYARFVPGTFAALSAWTLVIILLASLYPAWFAARLEPVDALRSA